MKTRQRSMALSLLAAAGPARHRARIRGAALGVAGLLLAAAPAASAAAGGVTARGTAPMAARYSSIFLYTFDQGETLQPGTRVQDATGHRHFGTVIVHSGGRLTLKRHLHEGHAAGYPSRCKSCGQALIEMKRGKGLDPGKHAFRFGVAIRLHPKQTTRNSNLVQKGYFNQTGGQYKLQVDRGIPSCVVSGARGRVFVASTLAVNDGQWHALSCQRAGRHVTLRVDRVPAATGVGRIGAVRNDAPVRVGGARIGLRKTLYHGDLDNVYLKVRR